MKGPKLLIWGLVAVLAIALGISLTKPAGPVREDVDSAGATKAIAAGAHIVDVRTPSEYESGHIPNAENVPVDSLTQVAANWDRKAPVLVYCATGARSENAAAWLTANGFEKVYNLKDGIVAWNGESVTDTKPVTASAGRQAATALPVLYQFYSDS